MILRVETTITLMVKDRHFVKKHMAAEVIVPGEIEALPDAAMHLRDMNKMTADVAWDAITEDLENFAQ